MTGPVLWPTKAASPTCVTLDVLTKSEAPARLAPDRSP